MENEGLTAPLLGLFPSQCGILTMRRRDFLALVGGTASGLAGCMGRPNSATVGRSSLSPTEHSSGSSRGSPDTPTPIRDSIGSVDLPVPRSEIRVPLPPDHIPAIIDPVFGENWADLEVPDSSLYEGGPLLPNDAPVLGVNRNRKARAYPLRILNWHEVVNDIFDGPLLVTYCPLCGSGITAERRVNGVETRFGVSGMLWRSDLVMYDERTESLWSQILGAAIRGPRTGERLSLEPSTLTTWGEWRETHASTEVLLPPPHSNTVRGPDATFDYFAPKYSYDSQDQLIGFDNDERDDGLYPRTLVIGIRTDKQAKAYPFDIVQERGVINDTVGDRPVVVAITPGMTLVAYDRDLDGNTFEFEPAGPAKMRAAGSRWERATGRAVDGHYEGAQLSPATDQTPMFWKGWSNFHPNTSVYDS